MNFSRYTDRARRVVILAQEYARMNNHDTVGAEHLLLGFMSEGEAVAYRALVSLAITMPYTELTVLRRRPIGATPSPAGIIPFDSSLTKVMDDAVRESASLGHPYIGTEHLLLALTKLGEGAGWESLCDLGMATSDRGFPVDVRERVLELLHGYERRERADA